MKVVKVKPPYSLMTPAQRADVVRKMCTGLRLGCHFKKSDYRP